MKLFGTHTSPYARKVRIVLAEKKIDYDLVIDAPRSPDSAVPLHNPLGRIPVLVLDDQTPVFDSPVIVEYLDNVTPNNKLMPQPNRERMEVKRWEALADGLLDSAVAIRNESLRKAKEQNAEWIALHRSAIDRTLAFMAEELGEKAYCMGTHFGLADIAVGCALGYLDFRFAELDWRQTHPNLARLYEKLEQRPSFQETMPRDA
ncbi:glutathione S-transferase [Oryzomicrobium terrae]|uniref:Glutathione S-transferase n=1 Tax=Oryzomicrobium terrae TaxID=1735038 RepID=A0A5C1EBN2_9RHOO|nr:glutathione S-transferase C-terminal domain-containing protein [Oryzomicrobium terrae]QEL65597.1 glutathione S-transferase [Oryzomicrobium terrae]